MKYELKIVNSITQQKEVFKPIVNNKVGMYVCGPTVYGEPHLGHARSAITFDIIYRFLTYCGYKVRYVKNITDVGHLEDENNDSGEDKIAKKAKLEKLEPMEVAQHYTNVYRDAMRKLHVIEPSIEPAASGHIPEQIETIEKIIENGLAYEVNGSVYFDVQAYSKKYHYGQLSGRILEELKAGSRELNASDEKRFHADFALWKKADKEHIMQWKSPWGMGFPGWHIECTAMSSKYLGIPFDIHGGGMDLKFPHHEAEIAQSFGAFNCNPVNYWIHNNMVTLDGQKMAKSKNNFITLNQLFNGEHPLLTKAYNPMIVRFFILQAHYSSVIDFSNEALQSAETALNKLLYSLNKSSSLQSLNTSDADATLAEKINTLCKQCVLTMCDDFNTAKTIAVLFEMSSIINTLSQNNDIQNSLSSNSLELLKNTYSTFLQDVLGIKNEVVENNKQHELIQLLLHIRNNAKQTKNYALSDSIRNQMQAIGISVNDTKNGDSDYTIK
jgi:cysteinyl-tRNA synthetase